MTEFQVGDRVRLSKHSPFYKQSIKEGIEYPGTILGPTREDSRYDWSVKWDFQSYPEFVYRESDLRLDYISNQASVHLLRTTNF